MEWYAKMPLIGLPSELYALKVIPSPNFARPWGAEISPPEGDTTVWFESRR